MTRESIDVSDLRTALRILLKSPRLKQLNDKIDKVEERHSEGNLSEHKANELSKKYKQERSVLDKEIKLYDYIPNDIKQPPFYKHTEL